MENVKIVVSRQNHRILSKTTKAINTSDTTARTVPDKKCNCRNANECPLGKRCLESSLVYEAEVITRDNGEIKHYIGMTANSFKERYRNHKKSYTNATYMNETELSKYIWKLNQNGRTFTLTWSILRHATPYSSGGKQSSLCTQDKLCVLKANKKLVLNSRSEIFTKCQHQKRFLAGNYEREYDYGRTRKL